MDFGIWYRTIQDIPPLQLARKAAFEFKSRLSQRLSPELRSRFTLPFSTQAPPWETAYLRTLKADIEPSADPSRDFSFEFLNVQKSWPLPLDWNPASLPRLWRFKLHSFEQISDLLKNPSPQAARDLHALIEDWVGQNPVGLLDGWHPYTTSVRLTLWTYALRAFPGLATRTIQESLWTQIEFLSRNKEYFVGGNHLFENLRALVVASLNFEGARARRIAESHLDEMAQELRKQVLPDGGHYERSPMYHLVVLQAAAETVRSAKDAGLSIPQSLSLSIGKMVEFARGLRFKNGEYPLWNDTSFDGASLDETVAFAEKILGLPASQQRTTGFFPKTGYAVLRNASGWEVPFDFAEVSPPELPAHGHADTLNVDLHINGHPLVVETGTSQYAAGDIRNFERSTAAHNTIEIGGQNQSEVWSSFRIGRKALPRKVEHGSGKSTEEWIAASHDGYAHLGGDHRRTVRLLENMLVVEDELKSKTETHFSIAWHFAPGVVPKNAGLGLWDIETPAGKIRLALSGLSQNDDTQMLTPESGKSWYAPRWNARIPRYALVIRGRIDSQQRFIKTEFSRALADG